MVSLSLGCGYGCNRTNDELPQHRVSDEIILHFSKDVCSGLCLFRVVGQGHGKHLPCNLHVGRFLGTRVHNLCIAVGGSCSPERSASAS